MNKQFVVSQCEKAIAGEVTLTKAADALDCYVAHETQADLELSEMYKEAGVLQMMLDEVRQHPQQREAIEARYKEQALVALRAMIDELTHPWWRDARTLIEPKKYDIPRSSPQELDNTQ
jgi:hypothetical protein